MKTKEKICRRKSLLWSLLFLLLFGWFLPLLLTNGIMSIMATRKVHTQIDRSVTTSMEKAVEIMEPQLAEVFAGWADGYEYSEAEAAFRPFLYIELLEDYLSADVALAAVRRLEELGWSQS